MEFPGLFEHLASDDSDRQRTGRRAVALAGTRVRHRFAKFLSEAVSKEERDARLSLIEDDLALTIEAACAECGHDDVDGIKATFRRTLGYSYQPGDKPGFDSAMDKTFPGGECINCGKPSRVAGTYYCPECNALPSVKGDTSFKGWQDGMGPAPQWNWPQRNAARRPRMCPYHKEVTDISLAAGDPTAGFNAMAQHAWTANHCQGGDYEGAKCNFKPDMVTQSYWDNKAEQAEHRRVEREEAQRLQELQPVEPELEATDWDQLDELHGEDDTQYADEPSAIGEGAEPEFQAQEPMPMAASTKEAEALKTVDVTQGGEGPTPKMDKKKWTVDNVTPLDTEGEGSPHPTQRVDITERIDHDADFLEGTKAVTEHQDVEKKWTHPRGEGGSWSTNQGVNPVTSKEAGRDNTVQFHNGLFAALAPIEKGFPGATLNGEPIFPNGFPQGNPYQEFYEGRGIDPRQPGAEVQQGVLGHTDPALDPVLRQMGIEDGINPDPKSYKRAVRQALEAEGRWAKPGQVQASLTKEAPGKQHMPGVSPKRNRQYEHIKERCLADGGSEEECKELAARTVNKQRSEHGETKSAVDVEKNPLRDFIPEEQVQEAITDYDGTTEPSR